tara:strand:+ start:2824 stop:3195 length:372 start_codon:yes stop_codon:yes gene_type:complete
MANLIDDDFNLSFQLGLDVAVIKEARPLIHEMGLRIGEILKDMAAEHAPSVEVMAMAQCATTAIILELAIEALEEDQSLYFRLLSAASKGLFDIEETENPRLAALYQLEALITGEKHNDDDEI